MRLIDADTAQAGMTITANQQTHGKGQRGRVWNDNAGESLLMSIITAPGRGLDGQFLFNACAAVAIAEVLQQMNEGWDVRIKWPNDIIVNDKKAGGVLIENIIRGNTWAYSIIGLGLNVLQPVMPAELPYAVSLRTESGQSYDIKQLMHELRKKILENIHTHEAGHDMLVAYNEYLFRRGEHQHFESQGREWKATVAAVNDIGQLVVQEDDGQVGFYTHGVINWKW